MKCPKCEKPNKPRVERCAFCNAKMPVRKNNANTKKVSKIEPDKEEKKEPIIELSEEKRALKKFLKKIKKMNKMLFVYLALGLSFVAFVLVINSKFHTITCTVNNVSETEKYDIKLVLKHNKNNITNFKYITESKTNSYDKTLKERYNIIIDELRKKDQFDEIVDSSLKNRSWKIEYKFDKNNLELTPNYIGIDLSPYLEDVNSFVKVLEKEIGFECK